jgi:hypothetical protein
MALPLAILVAPDPPAGPRPGLLDAVVGPMDMPAHVQTTGAQWWSEMCGAAHLYPPACLSPPYPAFTADAADGLVSAYPFLVYASEICTPVGTGEAEAVARAKLRLRMGEQYAIEQALWGGDAGATVVGVFETLQAAGKVTSLADSPNVVEAVSLLEQQASAVKYNGPLFIHARPRMAAYMASKGTLIRTARPADGVKLFTHYGSQVVFGAGYSGNKPDGTVPSPTAEEMYITGRIFLWREPDVFVQSPADSLNRSVNQRTIIVGRAYAIGVECLTAATLVTRAG